MPQPMKANSPEMVGGIIQDFITKFIKDYLLNLKPDLSKLDVAMNKQGFGLYLDSFKNIISGTLDDSVFDAVKSGYGELIDYLVKKQPVPVGAPIFTKQDAQAFLATLPGTIDPTGAEKLLENPQLLECLKKLTPEKAAKIINNPAWLDRLINILIEWGPLFLKIAMMIIPFFI